MKLTKRDLHPADIARLFEEQDAEFLSKVMDAVLSFTKEILYTAQPLNRTSRNKLHWIHYISDFYVHGLPKDRRTTRFYDTACKRTEHLSAIEKYLQRPPTSGDFKALFGLKDASSADFYLGIDADIQNLLNQDR